MYFSLQTKNKDLYFTASLLVFFFRFSFLNNLLNSVFVEYLVDIL